MQLYLFAEAFSLIPIHVPNYSNKIKNLIMLLIFILIHLIVSPVSRGFSSKVHSIVVLLMHYIQKYFVDKNTIFYFSKPFSNKSAVPNFDLQSKYFLRTKLRSLFTPSASFGQMFLKIDLKMTVSVNI